MAKFSIPVSSDLNKKAAHTLATCRLAGKRVYDAMTGLFAKMLKPHGLEHLAPAVTRAVIAVLVLQVVLAIPFLRALVRGLFSFASCVAGMVLVGILAKKACRFLGECSAQVAEQEGDDTATTAPRNEQ